MATAGGTIESASGAAREGLHGMAAGPGGRVFCVWLDLRNAERGGGTEIWGTRSHDAGRTWSADFLVYRSPAKSVCQCCHPSVAYGHDGKTVAVMFRNELSGARDMYLVTSSAATPGGDFRFSINILPGDTTGDGRVLAQDYVDVKKKFFKNTASPVIGTDADYSPFHDVDGSGQILARDYAEVKKRFFTALPLAQAAAAPLAVFGESAIAGHRALLDPPRRGVLASPAPGAVGLIPGRTGTARRSRARMA